MRAEQLTQGFAVDIVKATSDCRDHKISERCRLAITENAAVLGDASSMAASAALRLTCCGPIDGECGAFIEGSYYDESGNKLGESFLTTAQELAQRANPEQ